MPVSHRGHERSLRTELVRVWQRSGSTPEVQATMWRATVLVAGLVLACQGCVGTAVDAPLASIPAVSALGVATAGHGLRARLRGIAVYSHAPSHTLIISDGGHGSARVC